MATNLERLKADLLKLSPTNRIFVWAGWDISPFSDDQLRQYLFTRDEMIAALSGQPAPQPKTIEVTVTSSNGLRVRAAPITGQILAVLPNHTTVTVFEIQEVSGWYKIAEGQYAGGYISAEYVKVGRADPAPTPTASRNRIGWHILPGAKRETLDMMRRLHAANRPVPMVTLVFTDGKYAAFTVTEVKTASPRTIVIARDLRGDDYHADDIGGWDKATHLQGVNYFNRFKDFLTVDIRKADFIQPCNVNEMGEGLGTNAWWEGMLDGADAAGVKLAVYNFSVGNPSLPGERDESGNLRPYNDFWKWQSTVDLLRRVKRDKHALCLHQYAYWDQWDEMMRTPKGEVVENTLLYRHRAIFRVLPADLQDMRVYFNESGESHLAEGTPYDRSPDRYRQRFRTQQHELDGDIGDPITSTWTLGTGGDKRWEPDELTGTLAIYEQVAMETAVYTGT